MTAVNIISVLLIAAGWIFLAIGAFGVARFPDFYTRLHAAGIGDTLGALLMTVGMVVLTGANLLSLKILLVDLFILLTNPLGTNLIIIGAIRANNYQGYNDKKIVINKETSMTFDISEPDQNTASNIPDDSGEGAHVPEAPVTPDAVAGTEEREEGEHHAVTDH